jgi:hypothetical protein
VIPASWTDNDAAYPARIEVPMTDHERPLPGFVKKEPKFCRCRVCHEHFYGETVAEARQACIEHGAQEHPAWGESACFCPD